jgi:hypothetical protein
MTDWSPLVRRGLEIQQQFETTARERRAETDMDVDRHEQRDMQRERANEMLKLEYEIL